MIIVRKNSKSSKAVAAAACAILIMLLSSSGVLAATTSFSTDHGTVWSYLEYYHNASGTWKSYEFAPHYEVSSGRPAYCLQHKAWVPETVVSYTTSNGSDYYSTSVLNGLQIIMQYGYPAGTGGLSDAGAYFATQTAIWMWLAENGDSMQWYQDDASTGQIRARSDAESQAVWNFTLQLLSYARSQKQMTHTVTVTADNSTMADDGTNYVGTFTVTLSGCTSFQVAESTINAVKALGGTVSPTNGESGTKVTVTIPKSGNAGKKITLSVQGMDRRMPENCLIGQAANTSFQRMIYTVGTDRAAAIGRGDVTAPTESALTIRKIDAQTGTAAQGDAVLTATFEITDQGGNVVATIGQGETIMVEPGTYRIRETAAGEGYLLSGEVKTVQVSESGTTYTVDFPNQVIRRKISIYKVTEAIEGTTKEEMPEAGAEFEVRLQSTGVLVATLVTDENGRAVSELLPYGTYVVHQTKGAAGFALAEDQEIAIMEPGDDALEMVLRDEAITREVRIRKVDAETGENAQGEAVLEAVFRIVAAGPIEGTLWQDGSVVAENVSADQVILLLPGTYRVEETACGKGYELNPEALTIEVIDTEELQTFTFENKVIARPIRVLKQLGTLGETEEKRLEEGAGFEIVSERTGEVICTLTTNGEGIAESQPLPYGSYTLRQTEGTEGFMLAEDVSFTIDRSDTEPIRLTLVNEPFAGTIAIEKTGLRFTGVVESQSEYGTIFTPVFEERPLGGVEFEIRAAEDIEAGGIVVLAKDEVAEVLTTSADGLAESGPLYPGNYYLKEVAAPEGTVISRETIPVSVVNDGETPIVRITVEVGNDFATTRLTLHKLAEEIGQAAEEENGSLTRQFETKPGEGFVFGLFADEALEGEEGEIPEGSLVAVAETDAEGKWLVEMRLPMGKYYVQELACPEGYERSEMQYALEIAGEGADERGMIVMDVCEEPIVNHLVTYPVTITKSDLTSGEPLPGAVIEIRDEEGELVYRGTTDENGRMENIELIPGTYTFTEISAPKGYERSEETITFTLQEDGEITGETEMKDKRIPEEPGNPDVPATGDGRIDMLSVFGVILLVAAGGMLLVIEVKKRIQRKER